MREYEAGIIRTNHYGANTYLIDISCAGIAADVAPGQFVQVRVSMGSDPFLRRTFSVCGADRTHDTVTLLVDVVGPGTELLCSMKRGGSVSVIGPLGRGFDMDLGGDGQCALVAGGSGAAPLMFLSERLISERSRPVTFMMGAGTADSLGVISFLDGRDITVLTSTDDGSAGFHGLVSELLENSIAELNPAAVFTCGPRAMMRAVAHTAEKASIPCQVSLEERMACGIGACLGCAIQKKDGRIVRSCIDGPVFNADEVDL